MEMPLIGWRVVILVAVAIVAAYLGVALLRLALLRGRKPAAETAPERAAASAAPAADALWKAEMEDEMRRLAQELNSVREEFAQLRAMKSMAPQYGDAVGLAQQGLSADDIAGRCGISVGEAELILALARKPPD